MIAATKCVTAIMSPSNFLWFKYLRTYSLLSQEVFLCDYYPPSLVYLANITWSIFPFHLIMLHVHASLSDIEY